MNVRQGLECDTHTGDTKHAILKALCGSDHWEHPKSMRAWPDTPPCRRQLRTRGQGGPKPGVQSFAYFPSMIRTASGQRSKSIKQSVALRCTIRATNHLLTATAIVNMSQIRIAVMGVTGSGKSTFIQMATQADVGIGHTYSSCMFVISVFCQSTNKHRHF